MTAVLSAQNTSVRAGNKTLLHEVNLRFSAGDLVAVVGENGAGKSTLLKVLSGVQAPNTGEVLLGTNDLNRQSPSLRAQQIASLGQSTVWAPDLTVSARIAQGLNPRRGPRALLDAATLETVHSIAEELGVDPLLNHALRTLSGGERRRVDVARALIDAQAKVYVLDEPHAGIDVRHLMLVSKALVRRAAQGAVVIYSCHHLDVALHDARRVVGLNHGEIVVDASPLEAFSDANIQRIFGVPGRVVVDGEWSSVVLASH